MKQGVSYVGPIALLGCLLCLGCADTSNSKPRPGMRERQDAALRDPFGYGPSGDYSKTNVPTVSGGGTSELDKEGLKRDLNSVFGP